MVAKLKYTLASSSQPKPAINPILIKELSKNLFIVYRSIRAEKILEQKLYITNAEVLFTLSEKCKFSTKIHPLLRICRKFTSTSLKSLQVEPLRTYAFCLAYAKFTSKPDVTIDYKQVLIFLSIHGLTHYITWGLNFCI